MLLLLEGYLSLPNLTSTITSTFPSSGGAVASFRRMASGMRIFPLVPLPRDHLPAPVACVPSFA